MSEICKDIKKQMNRIKGQLAGVEKMIDEARDPLDIIQQVSAVRAALSRLAVEILKDESKSCFKKDKTEEKLLKFEELVTNLFKVT